LNKLKCAVLKKIWLWDRWWRFDYWQG